MSPIKKSLRRLVQNKNISIFSIIGFMLCFILLILIIQFVVSEQNVDKMHKNKQNIYTVSLWQDGFLVKVPLFNYFESNPNVKRVIPFDVETISIKGANQEPFNVNALYADSAFFASFSFEFEQGDKYHCLDAANQIVLTQSVAKKHFGQKNAIGKILLMNGKRSLVVTGVIQDYPKNSLFKTHYFVSFDTYKELHKYTFKCGWGCSNLHAFVELYSNSNKYAVESEVFEHVKADYPDVIAQVSLVPFVDTYYANSSHLSQKINRGSHNKIMIFKLLGALLLLITLVNHTNFTLSLTAKRKKVNATLKVFGTKFHHFMVNSFIDTLLVTLSSLVLAFGFCKLFLNEYLVNNFMLFKQVQTNNFIVVYLLGLIIFIAIISSFISALLSNRHSITKSQEINKNIYVLNKLMLCLQFGIVVFLIVSSIAINKQLVFMQNSYAGFDKENTAVISTGRYKGNFEQFYESFTKIPGVIDVSFSSAIPGKLINEGWGANIIVKEQEKEVSFRTLLGDASFVEMYDFNIIQGKTFEQSTQADYTVALINEAMLKHTGWENPIGKILIDKNNWFNGLNVDCKVIGVFEDNHFTSVHSIVPPQVIFKANRFNYISVKMAAGFQNQQAVIGSMKKIWTLNEPDFPFDCFYMDKHLNSIYQTESDFTKIIVWLSVIAIIITVLGLVGVVIFTVSRMTKEIGVRKVNGARVYDILMLINKGFALVIIFALLIAIPLAYYFTNNWLHSFAYQTALSIWLFIVGAFVLITIAVATISWQTYKAARRNPVEALRYE